MKCIMSIKSTKNVEVGLMKRVSDKDADSEVKSGYWKYIPKSEYKKSKIYEKTSEKINSEIDNKNEKKVTKSKNSKVTNSKKS